MTLVILVTQAAIGDMNWKCEVVTALAAVQLLDQPFSSLIPTLSISKPITISRPAVVHE
jgi:hypothetical protein